MRLTDTVVLISVGTTPGASFTSDRFFYGTWGLAWGTSPKGILLPLPVRYPHSCSLMVEVIRFRNWAQAVSDMALWTPATQPVTLVTQVHLSLAVAAVQLWEAGYIYNWVNSLPEAQSLDFLSDPLLHI